MKTFEVEPFPPDDLFNSPLSDYAPAWGVFVLSGDKAISADIVYTQKGVTEFLVKHGVLKARA